MTSNSSEEMDHDHFKEQLFLLYDGQLSAPEAQDITDHLSVCPDCQKEYSDWQKVARIFFKTPHVQPSPHFVKGVMSRIEIPEKSTVKRFSTPLRWLVPALGTGLMIILLGWGLTFFQTPQKISLETLLLTNGREANASEWMFRDENPEVQDLLALVLEEP